MMKCVETSGERKVLPGQWCVTGDIREVVQGQPSLTATTLLDINAGVVLSRHGSVEAEDVSVHHLGACACTWTSCRAFFFSLCLNSFCISPASIRTTWFLMEQRRPPRWSQATRTRVDVLGQRAGNLNLHTPCLQLPDLLLQEPGLLLHALFPHPAEH